MPSFYVKRTQLGEGTRFADGHVAFVGPLKPLSRAERERDAWNAAEGSLGTRWSAEVLPSTPEVRAQVRAWRKENASRTGGKTQHA